MAKILMIDDDPDIIQSTKIVLESKGHQVIAVSSGQKGLAKAKEIKPDLVILDVMMETRDKGFEVARELKKDAALSKKPILMLTSLKEKTGLNFKKEAGDQDWLPVDEYCDKPLSPDELIKKVEKLIKKR